jgi:hypothetical protein
MKMTCRIGCKIFGLYNRQVYKEQHCTFNNSIYRIRDKKGEDNLYLTQKKKGVEA